MQCTTKSAIVQLGWVRLHTLVVLSLVVLAVLGRMPGSQAGWMTCQPQVVVIESRRRRRGRRRGRGGTRREGGRWLHLSHTWHIALVRSLVVWVLWHLSGQMGSPWVRVVPWGLWLWQSAGVVWPWLRRQPEWRWVCWMLVAGQRLVMVGYVGLATGAMLRYGVDVVAQASVVDVGGGASVSLVMGMGCAICGGREPWVEAVQEEDGGYTATMCGHFTVHVPGGDPFRVRMLMVFLRLLAVPGWRRGSRRTRDGRMPFVSQQQAAAWFHTPQPNVSRVERYWLAADWPNLLSLNTAEVLTGDVMRRIVAVFATFPWWRVEEVHGYLQEEGLKVSQRQVRQAAEDSGWSQLRQELKKRYHLTADDFRPGDRWLVGQLLTQVETLVAKLEGGEGLTPEEVVAVKDIQTLASEIGVELKPPGKALPWMMCVERVVFGHWQEMDDGQVRCIYCGSPHVVRKSRKPRLKKYYDAEGNLQTVAVYRYYCRNKACDKGSFTHLPSGLVPYSRHRTEVHLLALQMYAWGYSTYRRTGTALSVASITAYHWVSAWGHELLPVAALFGVVKSSGVVGIDEKYVLVPKNDKPAGKMRRWMYVYFAVDVYTYDLLHIAIYPYNDKDSALAFLLALRAKGYHPRVVVTDLRQDYGPLIAQVFPLAQHHECIFHALQNVQDHVKDVYGAGYAQTHPEAEALKQDIYHIFAAKTKRTARQRYEKVMALREPYVHETPAATTIFDFLERHWPTLANGIESKLIPTTNNTVELVIRRFDQHYQNFCGFESIDSAQLYLAVFEKVYRFTPFSNDAQPRIRGKCPLELAGYDISQVPMASLCAGWSPVWPLEIAQNHVPN